MNFHIPVLLNEVLEVLTPKPKEIFFDGTLGGGGHALEIAKRIAPGGTLIGTDLDPEAIKTTEQKIKEAGLKIKFYPVRANYKNIDAVLTGLQIEKVDGILADVGISSYDLENSGRGFSFQKDEPLDMRFDPESTPVKKRQEPYTAKFILDSFSEKELEELFRDFGEEPFSKKISRAIVATRQEKEINSTTDLFNLIKHALPAKFRFKAGDSARRIFQALRIEVNSELDNLSEFLPKAFEALTPGGRMAIISFHSLEDRIVKQFFADKTKGCICPPEFPECRCGRNPEGRLVSKKPIMASEQEQQQNSRSRPAKLRAIIKI